MASDKEAEEEAGAEAEAEGKQEKEKEGDGDGDGDGDDDDGVEERHRKKKKKKKKKKRKEEEKKKGVPVDSSCRAIRSSLLSQNGVKEDMADSVDDDMQEVVNDVKNKQEIVSKAENKQEVVSDVENKQEVINDVENKQEVINDVENKQEIMNEVENKIEIEDDVENKLENVDEFGNKRENDDDVGSNLQIVKVVKEPNVMASGLDKNLKGIWKDEWVASLIHLRGTMNDEFNKPQKSGLDVWSRLTAQMTETHEGFDKNSESCRKKWQRIYKQFRDSKALLSTPGSGSGSTSKQGACKWFDLVNHYMHNQAVSDIVNTKCEDMGPSITPSLQSKHQNKRARQDQKIKESLSQMVETWRESLEVLKDSEAKRLATLQRLNGTMTGLLDILRK